MSPLPRMAAVGLVLLGVAGGCKTRVIDIPVQASPEQIFALTVGSQGGRLTVDDPTSPAFGTEIMVPAGAVDDDAELSVRPAAQPPAGPLGLRPTGPTLLIRFTTVKKPVTVRMPFRLDLSPDEAPVISRYGEDEDAWSNSLADALPDGTRRLEVTTEKFGWFFTGGQAGGGVSDGGVLLDAGTSADTLPEDQLAPTFEGLLSAEVVGQGQAMLTWKPASDDRSAAEAIRYRLYLPSFAVLGAPQGDTAPGATELTLPVQPGVPYYFLVRAVDEAGNEDSNLRVVTLRVPLEFDGGPDAGDGGPDGSDLPADMPDLVDGPPPSDMAPQVVGISIPGSSTITEGGAPGIVRVTRSSAVGPLTVSLVYTANTTVTRVGQVSPFPVDLDISPGSVGQNQLEILFTIPPGETTFDLSFSARVDTHVEDDEVMGLDVNNQDPLVIPDGQGPVFLTVTGGGTQVIHTQDSLTDYAIREGSFRLGLERAQNAGGGAVDLGVSGTMQLAGPLPLLDAAGTITILQPPSGVFTLRGDGTYQIVEVRGTLVANNLGFENGFADLGGAMYLRGNLSCTGCVFNANTGTSAGTAVFMFQVTPPTAVFDGCTFSNNGGGGGGAINNSNGTLTVRNSTFVNNAGGNIVGGYMNGGGNSPTNP